MSFSDRAILWLHIVAAIFTLGPVTAAIMSTPRYIRKRNRVVVGYLCRVTEIYTIASVLVLIFGLILTQLLREFSKPWVSASITLYVVAVVLLVLIIRDQRKAMTALAAAEAAGAATVRSGEAGTGSGSDGAAGGGGQPGTAGAPVTTSTTVTANPEHAAAVERGRIASMAGITALIWLAILVMMVWGANS
ncbi:MAG TPA: DUF2269 family protein [Trebonia sp.]|nr:DUF2269 family protein [Trebonia sp.]